MRCDAMRANRHGAELANAFANFCNLKTNQMALSQLFVKREPVSVASTDSNCPFRLLISL